MGRYWTLAPEVKKYKMREYSDGIRIAGGLNIRPAPYLPVISVDQHYQKGIVIEKGTFVTFDEFGYLVPAYTGNKNLTYTALDVTEGVFDIDQFTNAKDDAVVAQAGTSTKTIGTDSADISIGKPVGIAMYDVFAWDMRKDYWYQVQNDIAILADRMILYAVDSDHDSVSYTPGDILTLDENGFPVPFTYSIGTTDVATAAGDVETALKKVEYGIGRLVRVVDLDSAVDADFTGGLENYVNPPDINLPGKNTNGIWDGIDETTKKGLIIQLWF